MSDASGNPVIFSAEDYKSMDQALERAKEMAKLRADLDRAETALREIMEAVGTSTLQHKIAREYFTPSDGDITYEEHVQIEQMRAGRK